MKVVYCTHSISSPGGMERVVSVKANYLAEKKGWEVFIVTTDQNGREPFFHISPAIKILDLGINYSENNNKCLPQKCISFLTKRSTHRKRLTKILETIKADIVVSLYPSESSFIPYIEDGSKKILELHYSRYFRIQYGRNGLLNLIDRIRTFYDQKIVKRFDHFVVLTQKDATQWDGIGNLTVIPNPAPSHHYKETTRLFRRVIAVGRLDYQKGFDRLIEIWKNIADRGINENWQLDIIGKGCWADMLNANIKRYDLENSVRILPPAKNIYKEYHKSDILVMTSNYEGFPMVILEALSCGLPVISYDCPCGPSEIIIDGYNGYLIENGDIERFANCLISLMTDNNKLEIMSKSAVKSIYPFNIRNIMSKWINLFENV